jgi:hypothetical protein
MTRRQKGTPRKKSGGVLLGMRQGVQKVAGAVTGADDAETKVAPKSTAARVWGVVVNVISVLLIIVAGAVLLRRCGILKIR